MNDIQKTAIRLIANAFLFGKEKGKRVTGYRFDSSFLTNRHITTINDLNSLQEELNKFGWCLNILNFNDYVLQDKSFLAEMTKLGFTRVKDKNLNQVGLEFLNGMHKVATSMIEMCIRDNKNIEGYSYISKSDSVTEFKIKKGKDYSVMLSSVVVGGDFNKPIITGYINKEEHVFDFEMKLPLKVNDAKDCVNWIVKVIENITYQEQSNKEIEACGVEKTDDTFNPPTVKIGDTEWMAENLAYDDGEGGIYINPDNKEYYYTWEAAKRVAKKLGWKLPSEEDWNKACEECGGVKDKYEGYDKCSLNKKLDIKLAGCYINGFYDLGSYGYFWSSSENSNSLDWYRYFDISSSVIRSSYNKNGGFSVRLVKEIENG